MSHWLGGFLFSLFVRSVPRDSSSSFRSVTLIVKYGETNALRYDILIITSLFKRLSSI